MFYVIMIMIMMVINDDDNDIARAVSVDSDSKARKVLGLLSRSGRDYFWTSGHKTRGDSVRWASGATLRASSRGRYPW